MYTFQSLTSPITVIFNWLSSTSINLFGFHFTFFDLWIYQLIAFGVVGYISWYLFKD